MEETQDSPIKQRSQDQREALDGEPVCTICGRYGEYICDQSDSDICSLECKSILLSTRNRNLLKIPVSDECIYIKPNNMLTKNQTETLRSEMDISIKGADIPDLIISFSNLNLPEKLESNIELCGFVSPTPVQMQAIPCALNKRNLLVSSSTGSGKTASYLIPIINNCMQSRLRAIESEECKRNPLAIVIAPSRELCVQIEEQAKELGKGLPFKTGLFVGGDSISNQIYRFNKGIELIIGTPGRLVDIFMKFGMELMEISILVLDEVDFLFKKEFKEQVMTIIKALLNPQILMFSATISKDVEMISSSIANNLVYISCGKSNESNKLIKQVPIWVETNQKKKKLFEILKSGKHFKPPVIIFVNSRLGADLLSDAIKVHTKLNSISIHGEKTMKERRENMKMFLTGEIPVLVCTGVLGRGMDILKLKQVIVFDLPSNIDEYLHFIGRASRRGEEGNAIVFLNWEDKKIFAELVRVLKIAGSVLPPQLKGFRESNQNGGFEGFNNKKRKVGF